MKKKFQETNFQRTYLDFIRRLNDWSINPWRRYSLFLITFLIGFVFGSSLGMINGVLALMDPIGAFFIVVALELMIRGRRNLIESTNKYIFLKLLDMFRIGLTYGLFTEAFKLF
tara:strand:+ start:150 stop:491 length:342 start_codon:yes stop_codon:yes gene_type:complete